MNGRPPWRPRARAEANPAFVRSNSARPAKISKISRPFAAVVSIDAPSTALQPDIALCKIANEIDQLSQVAAEMVEFPNHKGIAGSQRFKAARETRTVVPPP